MSGKNIGIDLVLSKLPKEESRKYLFNHLDHETLKSARCVNKLWQSLVDPMVEFKVELSDTTKKYVERFGKERHVQTVSVTSFYGLYPENGIYLNACQLNMLELIEQEKNKEGPCKLGISQHNFRWLMQDFYNIEKLKITSKAVESFNNPKLLSNVELPNLKEVVVVFFNDGFQQLIPFLCNRFPTLEIADIGNAAEVKERHHLYPWIYGFVANHYKNLKELKLLFPEGMPGEDEDSHGLPLGQQLQEDHKMSSSSYENTIANLKKVKLGKFILYTSTMEGVVGMHHMRHALLNSQTQLTQLQLHTLEINDIGLLRNMEIILEKCSETLTSLSLAGCFCGPSSPAGTRTFSCSWLKNCKKLKELKMVVCGLPVDAIEDLPKSLQILNLGHMLKQDQIEYIALNLVNLEIWGISQRAFLTSEMVPKISLYLFEAVLYLPKLRMINLDERCAERDKILDFVAKEEGIHLFCRWTDVNACLMDDERSENLSFYIDRKTFLKDHSCLKVFMEKNRREPAREDEMDHQDMLNLLVMLFREFWEEDDEDDFPEGLAGS